VIKYKNSMELFNGNIVSILRVLFGDRISRHFPALGLEVSL
jgi:hypothetical protein